MYCIIPAAGKGTRFGAEIPKALIKVNGESILSRQIKKLQPYFDVRVVIGYKKELVIEEISNKNFKIDIFINNNYDNTTVVDSVRIGASNLNENILVVDGDVLFDSIESFITTCPTIGVKKITSEQPMYATTICGKVTEFSETGGNCEWAGISIMPSSIYNKPNRYVCDAITEILPAKAQYINAFEIDTQEDLKGAEKWITS